jgi:LSD1 subclass zinc finger protein
MQEPSISEPVPALHRFPCGQCGASLQYTPGQNALRCTHCGYENHIDAAPVSLVEHDYLETLRDLAATGTRQDSITIDCTSCGASFSLNTATHAGQCPFCGSPVVAKTSTHRQLQVQALLPFRIPREQARATFQKWLHGLWFAPDRLRRAATDASRLVGMYVPYWTYDAATATAYRGQRGDDYQVEESYRTVENGREVEKTRIVTRTRWTPVSGHVARDFDDVLVLASQSLPREITERLEPWDLEQLVPYREEYLSGFQSEMYQIDLEPGFKRAREIMAVTIERDICRDIGGDHQRISAVDTRYDRIRFKHILLPVWLSAFRFRDRTYRFVVNGRSGKVQGERPYSAWKITFAIVLALALAGGGWTLWQHYHQPRVSSTTPTLQMPMR